MTALPTPFTLFFIFCFGAVLGSFLNVVVYRLPLTISLAEPVEAPDNCPSCQAALPWAGKRALLYFLPRAESMKDTRPSWLPDWVVALLLPPHLESMMILAWPPSHCPGCDTDIHWYDNIPILSWFLLGGRCRNCKTTISWRYPLNEFANGLLWVLLALRFGLPADWHGIAVVAGMCALGSALLAIFWIDIDYQLILNVITFPGIWLGLAYNLFITRNAEAALLGCMGGYLVGETIARVGRAIFKKDAFGGGDVMLMAMLGAWMGWRPMVVAVFAAFLIGSMIGLTLMFLRKVRWKQYAEIPFGPALVSGGLLAMFTGPRLWDWYIDMAIGKY